MKIDRNSLIGMHPITKFTAAKLLILLNLPIILILVGALEFTSSIFT